MQGVGRHPKSIAVLITTKNRPEALRRNLTSLVSIADLIDEVIIGDDASDQSVHDALDDLDVPYRWRVLRFDNAPGYIVVRNRLANAARVDFLLSLDDDAFIITRRAVEAALAVMQRHHSVAVVAFAQGEVDGTPWPVNFQPSRATSPSIVTTFIGFAALLRRADFLSFGGYREEFRFYGEEKEFSLRLLNDGKHVAYVPSALIGHQPDQNGRSPQRYLRFVVRNDCLNALFNYPVELVLTGIPYFMWRYTRMAKQHGLRDSGGILWLIKELLSASQSIREHRRPVRRATLRQWARLRKSPRPLTP